MTEDQLANVAVRWREEKAICVVLAAPGYPDAPQTGQAIVWPADGLTQAGAGGLALVYHAGSREVDGVLQTAGGRVLVCTGVARSFALARKIAYEAADAIYFDGKYLRRDIALHLDAAD
ncbi:hypothetical protein GCM10025857_16610 [Alicyclobacillus contaminans]|nr:hypothetical protein GCM10025857_16610 [Alicyclobacillus contaminans]